MPAVTSPFRFARRAATALALASLLAACAPAAVTGRQQFIITSEAQEIELGEEAYRDTLSRVRVERNTPDAARVERVGRRLANASERPDYPWEFTLIDDPQINAFALPGGKIAVYKGLPLAEDDAGLATVMAHEAAHVLVRHGAERISAGLVSDLVRRGVIEATGGGSSRERVEIINTAYGLSTNVAVFLPFSREQEFEADQVGMLLMAQAGYDPREAIRFWQRMSASRSGPQAPEYVFTHPADARRIEALEAALPEALEVFEGR